MKEENNFVINKKKFIVAIIMIILFLVGLFIGSSYSSGQSGKFIFSITPFNYAYSSDNSPSGQCFTSSVKNNNYIDCTGEKLDNGMIECTCHFKLGQVKE